jgi:hypothetical protein
VVELVVAVLQNVGPLAARRETRVVLLGGRRSSQGLRREEKGDDKVLEGRHGGAARVMRVDGRDEVAVEPAQTDRWTDRCGLRQTT